MPAGREIITNTPLSGAELRQILQEDFRKLTESHGLLSNHVAYGRIGYEIEIRLHPANATFQDNTPAAQEQNNVRMKSKPGATNLIKANPALAAIDTPPLSGDTGEDAVVVGQTLTRSIDSPNAERLRNHMPIPTTVRDTGGNTRIEMVQREMPSDIGPGNVHVDDTTASARAAWGLPPEPAVDIEDPEDELDPSLAAPPTNEISLPDLAPELERARKLAEFFEVDVAEFTDGQAKGESADVEQPRATQPPDGAVMAEIENGDPT